MDPVFENGRRVSFTKLMKNLWNSDNAKKLPVPVRFCTFCVFVPIGLIKGEIAVLKDRFKK